MHTIATILLTKQIKQYKHYITLHSHEPLVQSAKAFKQSVNRLFLLSILLSGRSARVVRWLDHSDAMCSRAWRALSSAGSEFNSSRGPGKARPPT